jgi:ParB family chromosome partitioning protein
LDGPAKKKSGKAHEPDADIVALEAEISREVGLSVKLVSQGGAGTLTFHFKDLDQLEGLLERLKK